MAHIWEPHSFHYPPGSLFTVNGRRCKNCEKTQSRESQYLWMRVVGYRWEPLAGRCKKK